MVARLCLALLALAGITAIAAAFAPAPVYREPPKGKVPALLTALQGTWEMNSSMRVLGGGGRAGVRVVGRKTTSIRIHNNSWSYIYTINGIEREVPRYEMILDPKASPATLDLKMQNSPNAQVALRGIIKVEGDTLTFCYVSGHDEQNQRPIQFNDNQIQLPGNGIRARTMTLKKVK